MDPTNLPLRYKPKAAAEALGLDVQYLYSLIRDGVFSPFRPGGRGPGKRLYLDPQEVAAYARGGREAVEEFRRRKEPAHAD